MAAATHYSIAEELDGFKDQSNQVAPCPNTGISKRSALSNQTRLVVFRFLTVSDFGACLAVCKHWQSTGDCHAAWWNLYMTTQRPDCLDPLDDELRRQIERPFGEDALGWRIAVLQLRDDAVFGGGIADDADESERYEIGQIDGYNRKRDKFHVVYDREVNGQRSVWIQDCLPAHQRLATRQKSIFTFISPPASWIGGQSKSCTNIELPVLRLNSWKEEVRHNVQNVPLRMLQRLSHHRDEVLFVVFSPCGSRLASCSRDGKTRVFQMKSTTGCQTQFELEAVLSHRSAAMWAMWWPEGPSMTLIVTTENMPGLHLNHTAGDLEIWKNVANHSGRTEVSSTFSRVGRWSIDPYDTFTACITWPADSSSNSTLCFTVGRTNMLMENNTYEQLIELWPGPSACNDYNGVQPLAILRLQHTYNPLHCIASSRHDMGRRILAMTGSMPDIQDQLCLLNFNEMSQVHLDVEAQMNVPTYDIPLTIKQMDERLVLSAKWGQSGDLILVNTRPYVSGTYVSPFGDGQQQPPIRSLFQRPLPFDLSTSVELILLDASTLVCVGIYGGHSAFTDKNNPFILHTDDCIGSDFLASGGEDGFVYVWHRHNRHMLRKMMGHKEAVNAVSWNGRGILASASDDFSVGIWAIASILQRSQGSEIEA